MDINAAPLDVKVVESRLQYWLSDLIWTGLELQNSHTRGKRVDTHIFQK